MLWLVVFLALLIPLIAVVLDSQLGRAIANRLERGMGRELDDAAHQRLSVLEGEVERLGQEVRRLEEESAFLHSLLEGKSTEGRTLPPGSRPQ